MERTRKTIDPVVHHRAAAERSPLQRARAASATFVDRRPAAVVQRQLAEAIAAGGQATAQRVGGPEEEELMQGRFASPPVQRMGPEEEEPLQGRFEQPPAQRNETGMPDGLKAGVEALSGMSMDDVRVHRNSPQPAQLNALAYAQGRDIHLAAGQEQHLPHEAWHVVQQAQGRVQPTLQMMEGTPVNDDAALEREADLMGAKAQAGGA